MIFLAVVCLTIATCAFIGWFAAGGFFSRSTSKGVALLMLGLMLLSLLSGLLWPGIIIAVFAFVTALLAWAAGEN